MAILAVAIGILSLTVEELRTVWILWEGLAFVFTFAPFAAVAAYLIDRRVNKKKPTFKGCLLFMSGTYEAIDAGQREAVRALLPAAAFRIIGRTITWIVWCVLFLSDFISSIPRLPAMLWAIGFSLALFLLEKAIRRAARK